MYTNKMCDNGQELTINELSSGNHFICIVYLGLIIKQFIIICSTMKVLLQHRY